MDQNFENANQGAFCNMSWLTLQH